MSWTPLSSKQEMHDITDIHQVIALGAPTLDVHGRYTQFSHTSLDSYPIRYVLSYTVTRLRLWAAPFTNYPSFLSADRQVKLTSCHSFQIQGNYTSNFPDL